MRTKKNRLWAAAALILTVTGFSACLKSDDVTPQRPRANILFINAFAGTGLDVMDGSTKLNSNAFKLGSLLLHQPYKGTYEFVFKKAGADSTVATTGFITYDSLAYYSLTVYGQQPVRVRPLKDDFTGLTNDKINYRFFHLSPNTPAVDLYLNETKIDSNVVYEGGFRNTFTGLTSSLYNPKLVIKLAGTDSVLVSNTTPNFAVQAGGVYTFMLTGLKDNTGDNKLSINNTLSYY
jgi:hypothetical protein